MIVNAYAVLDAFISVLRLGLGLAVLTLAFGATRLWFRHSAGKSPEQKNRLEDRYYLLLLMAGLLLGLNVLSWPLLYLLLQSYVPEWPGVMCIYGVTRIGAGSDGSSRFLPPLLTALQAMKPALVFLSGAWFILHLANRRTRTAPLTGRVLLVLLASALLATVDAAAESAYLAIPKKEESPWAGCCTTATEAGRYQPSALVQAAFVPELFGVYYTANLGMAVLLARCLWPRRHEIPLVRLSLLGLAAVATLALNAVFLTDAASPRLLHLPQHHCPYDLIGQAPLSLIAVALFLGGCFCVGWAWLAARLGRDPESRPVLVPIVIRLLRGGLFGYLASVVWISVLLVLA